MSKARQLGAGGSWLLLGQLGSVLAQFVYTAFTARMLSPQDFAIYAVAVIISNFVAIFSVAGLGQAVARLHALDTALLRSLSTIAFIVGLAAMLVVAGPAPLWASVWENSGAAPAVALAGVSAFFAPAVGLLSGYMRRVGRFRALALTQLSCTIASFAISLALVWAWRTPLALVASIVMLQLFTWIALVVLCSTDLMPGRVEWRMAAPHLSFSWRVTAANVMAFALENVPRLAVSRFAGASALGYWNRADVVATIPFDRVNTALAQVLYPEYRHDISSVERIRHRWPDMLAIVAWLTVPTACFVAGASPVLVPILLGDGWLEAIPIVAFLAFASAIRGVSLQLASALEAIARFRWIWVTQATILVGVIPVVAASAATGSVWIALWYFLLFPLARHLIHLTLCIRNGLFTLRAIVGAYWQPMILGAMAFCVTKVILAFSSGEPILLQAFCVGMVAASAMGLIWLFRRRLALGYLVETYGFGRRAN